MRGSLVVVTVAIVAAVVLLVGAGLLWFVTGQDDARAQTDAQREQAAVERALRDLAAQLVDQSTVLAEGLSEGTRRRLRTWLEQEPLGLYRDASDPSKVDVEALMEAMVAQVRRLSRAEADRLHLLTERLDARSKAQIEEAMRTLRAGSARRAGAAVAARRTALAWQLGLLLLVLATLLALALIALVVRPVRGIQSAVQRIAGGALATPVPPVARGAREIAQLGQDVERMREQIRAATVGLEDEVARKTASLETSLAERTAALGALEQAQERLVQSAKMAGLGTLAGGVAHEFNNLLGGILGCIESARSETTSSEALEDLEIAERTAQRATTLVEALLDVARPGQRVLRPVDLAGVVDDVVQAAQPTAQRRQLRLRFDREATPPVLGDAGQLHQVVLNLLTNALQAVEDGGTIVVRTGEAGGGALAEVRDDGPGVPEGERARIFEPFFTGREDGTGLGLFVSYGIVERHGGQLEVGGAAEGGARFTLHLPQRSAAELAAIGPGVANEGA